MYAIESLKKKQLLIEFQKHAQNVTHKSADSV